MMYEIANIINSRPIRIISGEDTEYPNPITPSNLIQRQINNRGTALTIWDKTINNKKISICTKVNWWMVEEMVCDSITISCTML